MKNNLTSKDTTTINNGDIVRIKGLQGKTEPFLFVEDEYKHYLINLSTPEILLIEDNIDTRHCFFNNYEIVVIWCKIVDNILIEVVPANQIEIRRV